MRFGAVTATGPVPHSWALSEEGARGGKQGAKKTIGAPSQSGRTTRPYLIMFPLPFYARVTRPSMALFSLEMAAAVLFIPGRDAGGG